MCEQLQLTTTQYDEITEHYLAVSKWLAKDPTLFDGALISIYPQGSLKIGTTVRPLSHQEFDLDLVCEVGLPWSDSFDARDTLDRIEARLKSNETYRPMVEEKNRCIRLNYANQFHMDILPAYPVSEAKEGYLKVPDRELRSWKDSNPKGFAQWFEAQCAKETRMIQKAAGVEALPIAEAAEFKPALKRAVQLIKRQRDVYFGDDDDAPISIVLTTVAANFYNGQASVVETINEILLGVREAIDGVRRGRLRVLNPSNRTEDLSERWTSHPERYHALVEFFEQYQSQWSRLKSEKGLPGVVEILSGMFGESVAVHAMEKQAEYVQKSRSSGLLGVRHDTAALTTGDGDRKTVLRPNTFYGE